jgi:RimJ/RimL family protein N-acetyltransferase
MFKGEKVILRGLTRADLPRLWEFNNDLEVELAGGGDPPIPQSLARLEADYDQQAAKGGRDGASFAIEADGKFIGQCALFNFNETAHTCELGIAIGDKAYWGRAMAGRPSGSCWTMPSGIAIFSGSGCPCRETMNGPFERIRLVGL